MNRIETLQAWIIAAYAAVKTCADPEPFWALIFERCTELCKLMGDAAYTDWLEKNT